MEALLGVHAPIMTRNRNAAKLYFCLRRAAGRKALRAGAWVSEGDLPLRSASGHDEAVWRRAETSPVVSVGDVYGYRARSIDDLVPVKVLKEGTKKPARVLIRFEGPAMEGREEWVPPTRLKVHWAQVDEFRAEEARWSAVEALSPYQDSAEVNAAKQVCELLVDDEIADFGYKDAHLTVHDVPGLAALAGVDDSFVTSHGASFVVQVGAADRGDRPGEQIPATYPRARQHPQLRQLSLTLLRRQANKVADVSLADLDEPRFVHRRVRRVVP
ncbi:MAG TPA: hypothetical protein VFJ14_00645 [Nocardioidaceae bacterium]|nr:hypothetical protein [Nocardioidaceae bacterium]